MSITKKLLPISIVASIILTACGGGGTNTQDNNSNNEAINQENIKNSISVPQKISIDIPDALKKNRNAPANKEKILNDDNQENNNAQSFGYQQLRDTIFQAEETINNVKKNMKYLTLMMPDIVKECSNTEKNKECTIPAGKVKVTVKNQTFSIGKILYTQQDDKKTYQQVVVLDLKPTLIAMGQSGLKKDLETVKWSTDKNHVETFSDIQDEEGAYNMKLDYDMAEDNSSKMVITETFSNIDTKGSFKLKVNDINDGNNTVKIETIATNKFQDKSDSFSSKGVAGDNGGHLITRGTFEDEEYAEKETFDANGTLLKSSYCHANNGCNIDEPSTWMNFDDIKGIVDDFNDDNFPQDIDVNFREPLELSFNQSENFPKNTYCEILPSDYNGSLNKVDIYNNSIGSFARFDDEIFGTLFDMNEKDNINSLPILCNNSKNSDFYQLTDDKRPTISIKE